MRQAINGRRGRSFNIDVLPTADLLRSSALVMLDFCFYRVHPASVLGKSGSVHRKKESGHLSGWITGLSVSTKSPHVLSMSTGIKQWITMLTAPLFTMIYNTPQDLPQLLLV